MVKIAAFRASGLWGTQWKQKTGKDYLRQWQERMSVFEKFGPVRTRQIGGRRFYEMHSKTNPELRVPQGVHKNVATIEKGFVLTVILQAASEQDLEEIERSLDTITFTGDDERPSKYAPATQEERRPDTGSFIEGVYKNRFFNFSYTAPPNFKPSALPPKRAEASTARVHLCFSS